MPTAVVTGGAGFLGSHLCDFLVADGYRVICVDNLETGSLQNVEHLRGESFVFLNHDITQHLEIAEPIDFVYHLASPASPIDYMRLPLHTLKVGSYGTHNALGLAKYKRARFLLASTSEVYGDPLVHPQPETYWGNVNPVGPRGVYDEAKRYAEAMTMAYHRQQGVDTAIVRIFNTYGPRMRPNDGRAVPTFVRQALDGEPITVFGDGTQTRSFCYVDDLVRGLVLLAESGEHMLVGIQDEANTLYGNPDVTFPILKRLRTQVLRVNLYWGGRFGVAIERPVNAANPRDPAYDWSLYDRTVNYASQYGIKMLFSIYGTPGWANQHRGLNRAPTSFADLQKFAFAAAKRYSGTFRGDDGRRLPKVRFWTAWNEPNNPIFLFPQFRRAGRRWVVQSAIDYAKICNAIYDGIHGTKIGGEQVACGVTAPHGNDSPTGFRPSVSPLMFLLKA